MQRLSEKKCAFELPDLPYFQRQGRTSLLFVGAEGQLCVYTLEEAKIFYWMALGLTQSFSPKGLAYFYGHDRKGVYNRTSLPVYYTEIPILERPEGELLKRARSSCKQGRLSKKRFPDKMEQWIAIGRFPFMKEAAEIAMMIDPDGLSFDARGDEMLIWQDRVIPIDPFVSQRVYEVISLRSRRM